VSRNCLLDRRDRHGESHDVEALAAISVENAPAEAFGGPIRDHTIDVAKGRLAGVEHACNPPPDGTGTHNEHRAVAEAVASATPTVVRGPVVVSRIEFADTAGADIASVIGSFYRHDGSPGTTSAAVGPIDTDPPVAFRAARRKTLAGDGHMGGRYRVVSQKRFAPELDRANRPDRRRDRGRSSSFPRRIRQDGTDPPAGNLQVAAARATDMDWRAVPIGVLAQVASLAAALYSGVTISVLVVAAVLSVGGLVAGIASRDPPRARFDGAATLLVGTLVVGGGLLVLARFRPSSLPPIFVGGMFGGLIIAVMGFLLAVPFVGLYGAGCAVLGARLRRVASETTRSIRG
jgi:hypothetical protein